jgi:hypothetical protein
MPVVEDVRMAELLLVSPTHFTAVTHLLASQFISRQWWSPVQITWRLEVQLYPCAHDVISQIISPYAGQWWLKQSAPQQATAAIGGDVQMAWPLKTRACGRR